MNQIVCRARVVRRSAEKQIEDGYGLLPVRGLVHAHFRERHQ
jgi:hypothetical protein